MTEPAKIPPPIENGGMNIHLSYIRRDVDEIKVTLKDLKNSYITQEEFTEHVKIADDHESRIRTLEESVTSTLSMIKTWGMIGGVILGGMQIVEIVYSITHTLR
jgi:hypothetical protein